MAYDLKYGVITAEKGNVTHGKNGVPLNESDEPCFVIRAQDALCPDMILEYIRQYVLKFGPNQEMEDGLEIAYDAVMLWQSKNRDRVKKPD